MPTASLSSRREAVFSSKIRQDVMFIPEISLGFASIYSFYNSFIEYSLK